MSRDSTVVSLFSGAGGLDIGFEEAGFETTAAVEIEPTFVQTLRANQGKRHGARRYLTGARIFESDIRKMTGNDLCVERPDVLVGGPPCQSFSSAGRMGSVGDPRGQLVYDYLRLVRELQPSTILFENVRGLVTARGKSGKPGEVLEDILGRLWKLGYSCNVGLLNAADFGLAQRRVRCFILGAKGKEAPPLPKPTHGQIAGLSPESRLPWQTLASFLQSRPAPPADELVVPTQDMEKKLAGLTPGSGLKSPGAKERTRPGGHWGYKQGGFLADLGLPARTVTGSTSQDWVRFRGQLRRLAFSEVAALQGFPSSWEFRGTKAQRFKQVGNAVPTLFGKIIGTQLRAFLREAPRFDLPAQKAVLPAYIEGAIAYTIREEIRNGESRRSHALRNRVAA